MKLKFTYLLRFFFFFLSRSLNYLISRGVPEPQYQSWEEEIYQPMYHLLFSYINLREVKQIIFVFCKSNAMYWRFTVIWIDTTF